MEEEFENTNQGADEVQLLTIEHVMELAPSAKVLKDIKATEDNGAKLADVLYKYKNGELKKLKKVYEEADDFVKKLEAYLLQELQSAELEGISGKVCKLTIKEKEVASVEDWTKFYAYIKRNSAFELLNKAVNQKACRERWDANKDVPGVGVFKKKTLSVAKA